MPRRFFNTCGLQPRRNEADSLMIVATKILWSMTTLLCYRYSAINNDNADILRRVPETVNLIERGFAGREISASSMCFTPPHATCDQGPNR